ncbi:MAG: FecR family protein [Bacteroidales bacterium]
MEYINKLLKLLKRGEINATDAAKLKSFLESEDESIVHEFETSWKTTNDYSTEFDKKEVLRKIENKIFPVKIKKEDLRRKLYISIYKYAAVLLLGFGISYLFNQLNQKNDESAQMANDMRIDVPLGSKTRMVLPDGTIVNLNAGSKLTYPAEFGKTSRIVELEGEGFFDVTKNAAKPFFVKTKDIVIKVLGTTFNVKSYANDKTTETTLLTGKIEIFNNIENKLPKQDDKPIAVLKPLEKAVIPNQNTLFRDQSLEAQNAKHQVALQNKIEVVSQPNAQLRTEWRNEKLIFANDKLSDILVILERWYDVEIKINYKEIEQIRFSGKFDKESIAEVLDVLSMIEKFSYKIEKNKVTIDK